MSGLGARRIACAQDSYTEGFLRSRVPQGLPGEAGTNLGLNRMRRAFIERKLSALPPVRQAQRTATLNLCAVLRLYGCAGPV